MWIEILYFLLIYHIKSFYYHKVTKTSHILCKITYSSIVTISDPPLQSGLSTMTHSSAFGS